MTEIVIIPAWRRPAFLLAALRRLVIADDPSLKFWITLDRGYSHEVAHVANDFVARMGVHRVRVMKRMHAYRGNSFNILQCYGEAIECKPELIHLVEEDVFVGADYFDFHRSAHALATHAFAVSLCRNQNYDHDPEPIPDAVYLSSQYQSIGVSFRPERLSLMLPHMTREYFRDPVKYCRRHFPRTKIPAANAEQDGLINRIVEAQGLPVVYATRPRAYHAGFVGYHRKGATLSGTIHDQADQLLAMTSEQMNAAAHSYPDHQVVELDARPGAAERVIFWP
jgi:hypothetical protein